ncbi:MAG: PHP domain-containing protein [Lentisphaeria bacterium]|nr:PHP domain-containing protein [Lentisphaeria bacterium]
MIDLHTHSTASDGSDSPSLLVKNAVEKGLSAVALTDHDTVSGIPEFLEAGREAEIRTVPGVELSCRGENRELHIVGLFIDHETPSLLAFLEKMRQSRKQRNEEMLIRLNVIGFPLTWEELENEAGGESIGRPHFAQALIRKGYFQTPRDVFEQCLKRGKRAYVPRQLPSPAEGIRAIHEAGGIAVWAHPVSHNSGGSGRSHVRRCLKKLIPEGLDAIESYYSQFTAAQHEMVMELAEEYSLLSSGGSDYHGKNIPGLALGTGMGDLAVPDDLLFPLEERWKKRYEDGMN